MSPSGTCPSVVPPTLALMELVLLGKLFDAERRKGCKVSVGWQEPPTAFDV